MADVDRMLVQEDDGVRVLIDEKSTLGSFDNVTKYAGPLTHLGSIDHPDAEAI